MGFEKEKIELLHEHSFRCVGCGITQEEAHERFGMRPAGHFYVFKLAQVPICGRCKEKAIAGRRKLALVCSRAVLEDSDFRFGLIDPRYVAGNEGRLP